MTKPLSFAFGGNTGLSYEDLQRRRMFAEGLMQRGMGSQPKTAMEGLNSAASSIMGALLAKRLSGEEAKGREAASSVFRDIISGRAGGMGGYGGMPATPTDPNPNAPQNIADDTMRALGKQPLEPQGWNAIRNGIFAGESGGDYNALFGFSNRPGGAFSGTKLTDMTVDQALAFADPSGPYGQHVKGQIGRVATPMGAYQVVGTTLRGAKEGLGLTGSERMTPELQDQIGQWIYKTQGTGAWEGYRGPQSGGGQSASPVNPMDLPALASFIANPYADPGQKAVAQTLMGQMMQSFDPSYQMDLERQRLELDAMRNPKSKPIEVGGVLLDQNTYQPIFDSRVPKGADGFTLSPGQQRFDAQGKPIASVAPETSRIVTGEEAKALGLDPSKSYNVKQGPNGLEAEAIGGGGVNIDMGGGSSKQIFDAMDERYGMAQSAYNALTALNNAEAAVDGGIINGYGANQILGLKKLGAQLGMDDSQIVNTETFTAAMAPVVAATLKATAGTANISNADMKFAEKAAAGDITLDARSIKRLIGVLRTMNESAVTSYSDRVNRVYPDDGKGTYARERSIFGLGAIPKYTPPAAGAPAKITGDADYEALPSGTVFVGPDGITRRKP